MLPTADVAETTFDGLRIRYDDRVLAPRSWTLLQSRWAAELLTALPDGPVLELCAGVGHIGMAAVQRSSRRLICVDREPAAAAYASANAERAGMADRVEVRHASLTEAVSWEERFPLVIADPPWVARADTGRYPEDPLGAIDGGEDGLEVARLCLGVAVGHLLPDGALLLQLGSAAQVDDLHARAYRQGLVCREVRMGQRGIVALFAHRG